MSARELSLKRAAIGVVMALLCVGIAQHVEAGFVPGHGALGQGTHGRNPDVSMNFDQHWAFVTNLPRSAGHVGAPYQPPDAYSTNKYVSPLRSWVHSIDSGPGVNTNVFNYLVEDTWRGCPLVMEWTTNTVAAGAGALLLATTVDTNGSTSDALSYNMVAAVTNAGSFPASEGASTVLSVYVPDPALWQPDGNYPFLLMSMVATNAAGDGADWPSLYCQKVGTNYTWECDAAELGGAATVSNYLTNPSVEITGAGWWTVGVSLDDDGGVNYYVKSGLGGLSAGDYLGTYRPVVFTQCYGLFGTFYLRNTSATLSPGWIIDEVNYYHRLPPGPSAAVISVR